MSRAAAVAALALLLAAGLAQAAERARRDVTVYVQGRQSDSFDLPDGDALCVRAHVAEEDRTGQAWRLHGGVELRVSRAGQVVWSFDASELVLRKAGVDRIRRSGHADPLPAGVPLPRCGVAPAASDAG